MPEYEFTFKFALEDPKSDPATYIEGLAEAGCDDALVGIGKPGRIALEFIREAASARDAVLTAFADARKALPTAKLIEVAPDLVGLTDIAEFIECTRQNVRKIVLVDATFPTAVHEGSAELFHLADVLSWAREHRGIGAFDGRILEVATVNREVNLANQLRALRRRQVSSDISSLCAPD